MADLVAIGLRALSFVVVLQAAGVPLFLWLFGDDLRRSARPIAALAGRTAVIGLLLTIAHQIIEPARLAGGLRGIFDGPLQATLLGSEVGTTTSVRVLGLALVALGWLKSSRLGTAAALAGGTLIVVSFAFMGHTATHDVRWLLASLLILHLLIIAFWFGGLWPLYLASRHEELVTSGLIIERFSRFAVRLVPALFVGKIEIGHGIVQTTHTSSWFFMLARAFQGFFLFFRVYVRNSNGIRNLSAHLFQIISRKLYINSSE